MQTYLTKRGATYYFRRIIPLELRAIMGKREFTCSLKTKDLSTAKRLCNFQASKTDQELALAYAALQEAATHTAKETAPPADLVAYSDVSIREHAAKLASWLRLDLEKAAHAGRYAERRQEMEDQLWLHEGNLSSGFVVENISLRQSEVYALGYRAVLHPATSLGLPPIASDARNEVSPALRLEELTNMWALGGQKEKSIDMWRRTVRHFIDICGDKPVEAITKRDVIAFVDGLVANKNSPATVQNRLNQIRSLFNFAVGRDLIPNDPSAGVRAPAKKIAEKERHPWTQDALKRLLASDIYRGRIPEGGKGAAAYFLPLLGMFTGARINELAQLRPQDVYEETYQTPDKRECKAWVVRFAADERDGLSLKNAASARRVPVHPELIRLGFIKLAQEAGANGDNRIFSKLEPDKYGTVSSAWGKWFGRYIRTSCGITDSRITFHSFRHGFKDTCRALTEREDVHDAITGHTNGSVARGYGAANYPLWPMVELMQRYHLVGITLPDPYCIN